MYLPGATDDPAGIELDADNMALVALPHPVVVDTHSGKSNFVKIYQIKRGPYFPVAEKEMSQK